MSKRCLCNDVCATTPDGNACVDDASCATNEYCNGGCMAKKSAGSSCNSNVECVDGSTCFNGQCRTRASVGGQCIVNEDCSQDDYCDGSVCTARKFV
jgi:hypothetical protein